VAAATNMSKKPHMTESVIMTPDVVLKVIYHMRAYWTREDPNRERP